MTIPARMTIGITSKSAATAGGQPLVLILNSVEKESGMTADITVIAMASPIKRIGSSDAETASSL